MSVSHSAARPSTVLIVDPSAECREVLRTVLQGRGHQTVEACEARQGLELLEQHRPRVVVLDLDTRDADDEAVRRQYACEGEAALVLLGRTRAFGGAVPDGRMLAKPYHYGPLIRTIEQLLDGQIAR